MKTTAKKKSERKENRAEQKKMARTQTGLINCVNRKKQQQQCGKRKKYGGNGGR